MKEKQTTADKMNTNHDLLKTVFEQHWAHARHVEIERLWITNFYVIISGIALGFMKNNLYDDKNIPIIIFLMIISLFCIAFSIKIDSIFKHHTRKAEELLKENSTYMMIVDFKKHWINRMIRISRLFPLFFTICFGCLLHILLKIKQAGDKWNIIIPVLIIVLSWISFDRLLRVASDCDTGPTEYRNQ